MASSARCCTKLLMANLKIGLSTTTYPAFNLSCHGNQGLQYGMNITARAMIAKMSQQDESNFYLK